MEKLKFALFSLVTLSLLGLLGYWSVVTLQSGTESKTSQKIAALERENQDLKDKAEELRKELSLLQQETPKSNEMEGIVAPNSAAVVKAPSTTTTTTTTVTTYKNQDLIDALQKLEGGNVNLKLKSGGAQVGTVQKFLNIYNKTSNKVDNDYGEATKAAVMDFQKDTGLSADGEAGPGTFRKMIDWLKKQG